MPTGACNGAELGTDAIVMRLGAGPAAKSCICSCKKFVECHDRRASIDHSSDNGRAGPRSSSDSVRERAAGRVETDQLNVRFTPKSGHWNWVAKCPLSAKSGHSAVQQKTPRQYVFTYTKALSPVIALPTISVFISRVPS
jgi:hypothetical protein